MVPAFYILFNLDFSLTDEIEGASSGTFETDDFRVFSTRFTFLKTKYSIQIFMKGGSTGLSIR